MKHSKSPALLAMTALIALSHADTNTKKGQTMNTQQTSQEGTFIPFVAAAGKSNAVAELLKGAAGVVRETEPLTLQWLALRENNSQFTIADFFHEGKGRDAHFAGKVAAALKQAAPEAVQGGWDKGVVANVENSKVLSYVVQPRQEKTKAALAVRIDLQAQPGKEEKLAQVLAGAAAIVKSSEPGTLLWYAIRIDNARFAIFDVFADEAGKSAHFAGKVAAALQAGAPELVKDGWEKGVVANITNYTVISATY